MKLRTVFTSIAFLMIVSRPGAGQQPIGPPSNTPPAPVRSAVRDIEQPVVVEGCVRGSRLKIDRTRENVVADALGASEFVLEGSRELLQQIRRGHDGHQDELTGTAILPASQIERDTQTTQLGTKTRVTVGARSGRGERAEGFRPVRLKVASLRHLDDKCSIPG